MSHRTVWISRMMISIAFLINYLFPEFSILVVHTVPVLQFNTVILSISICAWICAAPGGRRATRAVAARHATTHALAIGCLVWRGRGAHEHPDRRAELRYGGWARPRADGRAARAGRGAPAAERGARRRGPASAAQFTTAKAG